MVLEKNYVNYESALLKLNLTTLEERRSTLNLKFAQSSIKNQNMRHIFMKNKENCYNTRNQEKYEVFHANTERKQKVSVIQMQHQLNNNARDKATYK